MNPLDILMARKGACDAVRNALVKALKTSPGLSNELAALLKADDMARVEFATALREYSQAD